MPTVRKPHATSVDAPDVGEPALAEPPVTSAAIANEKGIVKPDVAQVEHRRVDRDERVVLQQRIRARARRTGSRLSPA